MAGLDHKARTTENIPVWTHPSTAYVTRTTEQFKLHTFCPAITTQSPSRIPMLASCILALSERAGRDWACRVRGRGELGLGKACLNKVRSSLATTAASAISKDMSRGSGTTSAGHCPFSFCGRGQAPTENSKMICQWVCKYARQM